MPEESASFLRHGRFHDAADTKCSNTNFATCLLLRDAHLRRHLNLCEYVVKCSLGDPVWKRLRLGLVKHMPSWIPFWWIQQIFLFASCGSARHYHQDSSHLQVLRHGLCGTSSAVQKSRSCRRRMGPEKNSVHHRSPSPLPRFFTCAPHSNLSNSASGTTLVNVHDRVAFAIDLLPDYCVHSWYWCCYY